MEEEVQAIATAVSSGVALGLGASIAASVITAVGGSVGGAAGGGVAAGGGMLPLLFGVQRFAASSGLGVRIGGLQAGVADSVAFLEGAAPFISPAREQEEELRRRRRRLNPEGSDAATGLDEAAEPEAPLEIPAELANLYNLLATAFIALSLTVCIQLSLVLAWRHCVNRRYYRHRRTDFAGAVAASGAKAPKFYPFPKSLIWPTPVFFTMCVFVTGLTRASVRLLAARPSDCGAACPATAISVLVVLVGLVLGAIIDLVLLHRKLVPSVIKWKSAARVHAPNDLADPWLRWRAKARVQLMSVRRVAAASIVAPLRRTAPRVAPYDERVASARTKVVGDEETAPTTQEGRAQPQASSHASSKLKQIDGAVEVEPWAMVTLPPPKLFGPSAAPTIGPPVEADELAEQSAAAPSRRSSRRTSFEAARKSVIYELSERGGHRDRKSGAFAMPEEDAKEPARTERILASPFALHRPRAADAFQSREGFFMFRVNGASFFGNWYRVFVVVANMLFGLLSGLQPLLAEGSPAGIAQAALILMLQSALALLCCHYAPDADRIISHFAATQFCFEALSTASLLVGSLMGAEVVPAPNVTLNGTRDVADAQGPNELFADLGFYLALVGMAVPMLQLLEQRLITPCIGIALTRGCNPVALAAALYMLAASLPRKLCNMLSAITGSAAGSGASADAGDDAVEAGEGEGEGDASAGQDSRLQGEDVAEAAVRASRLLARAVAAKEAGAAKMATPNRLGGLAEEEADLERNSTAGLIGASAFAGRMRKRRLDRAHAAQEEADADDGDGGGDDD